MTGIKIKRVKNERAVDEVVLDRLNEFAQSRGPLEILEAGCGRRWPYKLDGIDFRLTGVDVDEDALRIRKDTIGDLDTIMVGDLRDRLFEKDQFDVIYSSYVLEHVEGVDAVIENFSEWLKPGGLLIIKVPDYESVYGFFTRITPHWFHIFYKRYLRGLKNAGKPGFGPYPTIHEKVIARAPFKQATQKLDMEMVEELGYGTLPTAQQLFTRIVSMLTLGKLAGDHYNLLYVVKSN